MGSPRLVVVGSRHLFAASAPPLAAASTAHALLLPPPVITAQRLYQRARLRNNLVFQPPRSPLIRESTAESSPTAANTRYCPGTSAPVPRTGPPHLRRSRTRTRPDPRTQHHCLLTTGCTGVAEASWRHTAGRPKDPPVEAWVDLFKTTGSSPPTRRTQSYSGRRRQ